MKIITPKREFRLSAENLTNYLYPKEASILMDCDLYQIPVIYEDDWGLRHDVFIKNVTDIVVCNLDFFIGDSKYEFDLEFINGDNRWVETGF